MSQDPEKQTAKTDHNASSTRKVSFINNNHYEFEVVTILSIYK
jgi:hypothetical protein